MEKAVLISIRPEWCQKIIDGEKRIEVRKTRPKMAPPFKCYIYCTAGGPYLTRYEEKIFLFKRDLFGNDRYGFWKGLNGKVIGEFVCDRIDRIVQVGFGESFEDIQYQICNDDMPCKPIDNLCYAACLSKESLERYLNGAEGYGWRITDLKIYDKPRELRTLFKPNYDYTKCLPLCNGCEKCRITRPPQSWCYVE